MSSSNISFLVENISISQFQLDTFQARDVWGVMELKEWTSKVDCSGIRMALVANYFNHILLVARQEMFLCCFKIDAFYRAEHEYCKGQGRFVGLQD